MNYLVSKSSSESLILLRLFLNLWIKTIDNRKIGTTSPFAGFPYNFCVKNVGQTLIERRLKSKLTNGRNRPPRGHQERTKSAATRSSG